MVMFTFPMKFLRCWDWSRNQFVAVLRPRMRTRTWWRRRQNNGMISQQTSAGNFNEQQSNRIEMIWTCCNIGVQCCCIGVSLPFVEKYHWVIEVKCHKCHSSETLIYLGILGFFLLNLDETSTMKSMRMFDTSIFPIFFQQITDCQKWNPFLDVSSTFSHGFSPC